ncbi:hypothetical protein B0H16DRAFT_1484809 [Mycena metata]|uniref:Uncharacterized protein n=1 Tax=Mycena metata TaxID=1033252 RepID=A0AAD7GJ85_9AGAR|nr:hypothetical protein B0H16DRAFT_1484809 [Mycena metata]
MKVSSNLPPFAIRIAERGDASLVRLANGAPGLHKLDGAEVPLTILRNPGLFLFLLALGQYSGQSGLNGGGGNTTGGIVSTGGGGDVGCMNDAWDTEIPETLHDEGNKVNRQATPNTDSIRTFNAQVLFILFFPQENVDPNFALAPDCTPASPSLTPSSHSEVSALPVSQEDGQLKVARAVSYVVSTTDVIYGLPEVHQEKMLNSYRRRFELEAKAAYSARPLDRELDKPPTMITNLHAMQTLNDVDAASDTDEDDDNEDGYAASGGYDSMPPLESTANSDNEDDINKDGAAPALASDGATAATDNEKEDNENSTASDLRAATLTALDAGITAGFAAVSSMKFWRAMCRFGLHDAEGLIDGPDSLKRVWAMHTDGEAVEQAWARFQGMKDAEGIEGAWSKLPLWLPVGTGERCDPTMDIPPKHWFPRSVPAHETVMGGEPVQPDRSRINSMWSMGKELAPGERYGSVDPWKSVLKQGQELRKPWALAQ